MISPAITLLNIMRVHILFSDIRSSHVSNMYKQFGHQVIEEEIEEEQELEDRDEEDDLFHDAGILLEKSPKEVTQYFELPESSWMDKEDQQEDFVNEHLGFLITKEELGRGAYGQVKKAIRVKDNKVTAVKISLIERRVPKFDEVVSKAFVTDVVMLQKFKGHPNIIEHFAHAMINDYMYIFLELAETSVASLLNSTKTLPEAEAKDIFTQVVYGLNELHRRGIAHNDLSLDNILLVKVEPTIIAKISDLGTCTLSFSPDSGIIDADTYKGKPPYASPQFLAKVWGNKSLPCNPFSSDIWSLGVCLFNIVTGSYPYGSGFASGNFEFQKAIRSVKVKQDFSKIKSDLRYPSDIETKLSNHLRELIIHLLDPDEDYRITIRGILSHPWVGQIFVSAPCKQRTRTRTRSALSEESRTTVILSRFL